MARVEAPAAQQGPGMPPVLVEAAHAGAAPQQRLEARRVSRHGIACEPVGRRRLRDIAQPVRVYRVAPSEFPG